MASNHLGLHSLELTYPPKMQVFNRNLLSQSSTFRGYVSFREGNSVLKFAGTQMVRLPIRYDAVADEILNAEKPPDMTLKTGAIQEINVEEVHHKS